jgi:hypothetical protein
VPDGDVKSPSVEKVLEAYPSGKHTAPKLSVVNEV